MYNGQSARGENGNPLSFPAFKADNPVITYIGVNIDKVLHLKFVTLHGKQTDTSHARASS